MSTPEKVEALNKLAELQAEKNSALSALNQWQAQARDREDGSHAQDRRFEETGQRRRDALEEASDAVDRQQALVDSLG